jgi:hypothetical protein
MNKLVVLLLILISNYSIVNAQQMKQPDVLKHIVLFGWKEGTSTESITKMVTAFSALKDKIPLVKSFEWGTNNSPENLANGLTHSFIITFSSEADRDAYLIHPDHKAFVAAMNPIPEKITVFDYWVRN